MLNPQKRAPQKGRVGFTCHPTPFHVLLTPKTVVRHLSKGITRFLLKNFIDKVWAGHKRRLEHFKAKVALLLFELELSKVTA